MAELHTIREIEESGEEILSALDATAYGGGTWHPSNVPFDMVNDSKQLGHLAYDLRVLEGDHVARHNGVNGQSCGTVDEHDSALVLLFTFQLRNGYEREDAMRAADAAEHALKALCSPPYRSRRTSTPVRELLAPGWLLVRCTMSVDVLFLLDPPVASVGAAPVNLVLPGIIGDRGVAEVLTGYLGSWSSTTPVTFTVSWTVDAVATGDVTSSYTDPDGEGALIYVVTATNINGSTIAYSQPLGGGGIGDCAVDCADTIAAAEAAAFDEGYTDGHVAGYNDGYSDGESAGEATGYSIGYADGEFAGEATGNAAGRAARVLEWRNPGLFSSTPTESDPNGIGVWSSPDVNGTYTVTMSTGTAGGMTTGTSKIWALVSASGASISVTDLYGAIRVAATGMDTSSSLRWWAVVMDTNDPTTANGWGAYGSVESGSTDVLSGVVYTTAAGSWAATSATASFNSGQQWIEASRSMGRLSGGRFSAGRRSFAGSVLTGTAASHEATTTPATVSLPTFTGGAWCMVGMAPTTTGLSAGDYTIRAQFGLVDLDLADAVGVGLTP